MMQDSLLQVTQDSARSSLVADRSASAVAHERLPKIQALYTRGQYSDALDASAPMGPIQSWTGPDGRLLAARLSGCLGAPHVSHILYRLAFREFPSHPRVAYYYAMGLLRRRGPLAGLAFVKQHQVVDADSDTEADWQLLQARLFSSFRDFQRADEHLACAERLAPSRPWVHVEKASLLFSQDAHRAAIESVQHALSLNPNHRPAIQLAAHLLIQKNRDDEALELLYRGALELQSGDVWAQLAALEAELELHEEASEHYQQAERAFRLLHLDEGERSWLSGRQSDAAYHLGNWELAAEKADVNATVFFSTVAKRLRNMENGKRVVLPVRFVRQHHDTCAPATLTALSEYWSMSVDHSKIVQGICYDGTPAHRERQWATQHGFIAREFRVTVEAAKTLIDRGVPFTLTTIGPRTGHLQAVVGYDDRRGTILIRDPSERHISECLGPEMVQRLASNGPRGMALVPASEASRLEGVNLPDAQMYDLMFELECGLQNHERTIAANNLEAMRAIDLNHRLTLFGKEALARYDSDPFKTLDAVNQLEQKYPEDVNLRLRKLACLTRIGRVEERRELLEQAVAESSSDPLFALQLCEDLIDDARNEPRVELLVQDALRRRPTDASLLTMLGELRWKQQRRDEAFEWIRLAACSREKNEELSNKLFASSRFLNRQDEAMSFLVDRHRRFIRRSTWPAVTLSHALEQNGQPAEAMAVLEEAMQLHPRVGSFMLYVARTFARYGRHRPSHQILAAAEPICRRSEWCRAKADVATSCGNMQEAIELWEAILVSEPLAIDAHRELTRLLSDQAGATDVLRHLSSAVAAYPENHDLRVLQIEFLRDNPEQCELAIRELLSVRPHDAWAYRELAINLGKQAKWEAAAIAVKTALEIEPSSAVVHLLRADVLEASGDRELAMQACRDSLRQSIDYEPALHALMSLCDTREAREAELEFSRGEFRRQTIHGSTIFTYLQYADGVVDDKEILGLLQEGLTERPDLWQLWTATVRWLTEVEQLAEADELAHRMVDRFPLHPSCWLYLSFVQEAKEARDEQIAALTRALEINPTWTTASRKLAEIHVDMGQFNTAEEILTQSLIHAPRDVETLACLASWNRDAQRGETAVEYLEQIVSIEPGFEWVWKAMRAWGPEVGRPSLAADAARKLVKQRPREARSWILLAESLPHDDQRDERLYALDQVLELNPRHLDAYAMKALLLSSFSLFDEAIRTCRPDAFADQPLSLLACEAKVTFATGQHERAIELMKDVVATDPDYYPGWHQLRTWFAAANDTEDAVFAAKQLVRIAPRRSDAWSLLAEAVAAAGDEETAQEYLERAREVA